MAKLAVIDNIISPGYQNYLEGLIGGTTFPWFYDPQITDKGFSYLKELISIEKDLLMNFLGLEQQCSLRIRLSMSINLM